MKVFPDTDVLAAGLMADGLCRDLVDELVLRHELLVGEPVRAELERFLRDRLGVPQGDRDRVSALLDRLPQASTAPAEAIDVPDPDDLPVVAWAVAGGADLFVTGDKGLLAEGGVEGLPVVSPGECRRRLGQG